MFIFNVSLLSCIEVEPRQFLVGLDGLEPSTPALSTQCSNQLSYRPESAAFDIFWKTRRSHQRLSSNNR